MNPQPSVLETNTLPIELLLFIFIYFTLRRVIALTRVQAAAYPFPPPSDAMRQGGGAQSAEGGNGYAQTDAYPFPSRICADPDSRPSPSGGGGGEESGYGFSPLPSALCAEGRGGEETVSPLRGALGGRAPASKGEESASRDEETGSVIPLREVLVIA